MYDITISIISHNSRKDLELLLPSLRVALDGINSEVLMIDNCSEDFSAEFVNNKYPEIQVRKNTSRLGYGANHNQNLDIAKGKYIVFMNADLILEPNALLSLLKFIDMDSNIGIVTPKIVNKDGSLQYLNKRHPAILDLLVRRFCPDPLKYIFKKRLDYYEMRDVGFDSIAEVPFISGSFMFCRTDIIRKVGGFDDNYFMYFEDVDLCRKIQKTYKTMYYPNVKVIHRWERGAHKNFKWAFVFIISGIKYFNKWGYKLF